MKKIIFYLIAVVFIAFTACEEQDNIDRYDLGAEFFVSNSGYTTLDGEVSFTIDNISKNLPSIEVTHLGGLTTEVDEKGNPIPFDPPKTDLGTISVSDGAGSISVSSEDLGMTKIGWQANIQFKGTIDGKPIVRNSLVTVKSPFTLTPPELLHSSTPVYFLYEIKPAITAVTAVTVETKVGYDGTYTPSTPVTGENVANDSIALVGTDYNIGDTVYVKVTAKAAREESVETSIVVASNTYFY